MKRHEKIPEMNVQTKGHTAQEDNSESKDLGKNLYKAFKIQLRKYDQTTIKEQE